MLLRDLQAEVVIDDIAAWTRDPAAALPSQADAYAAAVLGGDDPDSAAEAASAAASAHHRPLRPPGPCRIGPPSRPLDRPARAGANSTRAPSPQTEHNSLYI